MAKINFELKPSREQIANYESIINYYLQFHNAKVKLVVRNLPIIMKSYLNRVLTDTDYLWIEGLEISTPVTKFKQTRLPYRNGIDDSMSIEEIKLDAYYVQSLIYNNLGKFPKTPLPNDDPYWKIWSLPKP